MVVPVQATTDKTIYLVGLRSCAIMASDMSMMRYRWRIIPNFVFPEEIFMFKIFSGHTEREVCLFNNFCDETHSFQGWKFKHLFLLIFSCLSRFPSLPWDFLHYHNDPTAHQDHCGRCRIRTRDLCQRSMVRYQWAPHLQKLKQLYTWSRIRSPSPALATQQCYRTARSYLVDRPAVFFSPSVLCPETKKNIALTLFLKRVLYL